MQFDRFQYEALGMVRSTVDLNCDMGEGFGHWSYGEAPDEKLMPLISSANVATGFHAGDPSIMDKVVRMAAEHGVGLGAHTGYRDLQGFGRRVIAAKPDELVNDILYQTGALREFGRRHGVALQHVKPHGALYMTAAKDGELSYLLAEALRRTGPELYIYCMDGSETHRRASEAGQPTIREFFADRDYDRSGAMVFTRKMRRLDPDEVARKCVRACLEGQVLTVEGDDIPIEFESICFHSDTPGALEIGTAIRAALLSNGVLIAPPGRAKAGSEPRTTIMAKEIRSPLPGTFYRRPAPDQPPFVEDGGTVAAGDVIGLIEVMKSFHQVHAEEAGARVRFLAQNEEPITAGAVIAEMD